MFCEFTKLQEHKWICKRCGRIAPIGKSSFSPVAKCRLPENYHLAQQSYVQNVKIKGVGDFLAEIIKKIGYSYHPNGRSKARLTFLNKRGIDWCDKHQDLIAEWINDEGPRIRLELHSKILKPLIRLAIFKARNQTIDLEL